MRETVIRSGSVATVIALALTACGRDTPAASATRAEARPAPRTTDPGVQDIRSQDTAFGALLTDVTAEVGVDFVHDNGGTGSFYLPESMGAGGALFDADADGDLDLYLVQGGDLTAPPDARPADRLYLNRLETGRLVFEDVTAAAGLDAATGYGMGVAVGDADADGRDDLYLTNFGANQLWRNQGVDAAGVPRFADVTAGSGADDPRWSVPALFVDLDRDGHLDLFVGNYVDFTVARHRTCSTKAGGIDFCGPEVYDPVPDRLFRGRGDGSFDDVTSAWLADAEPGRALGVLTADFDRDGALDLYVANDGTPNHLWRRGADGRWTDEAFFSGCAVNADGRSEASMGVDAEDMDGDGDPDLVVSHLDGETNTLYRNDGDFFTDVSIASGLGAPSLASTGFGIGWLDLDFDGVLDLVVTNGAVRAIEARLTAGDAYPYSQADLLFRASPAGGYRPVPSEVLARPTVGRGLLRGDLDNDGDLDLVLTVNRGPARVLLRSGAPEHWLGVLPLAGTPAREVVGAEVAVLPAVGGAVWRRAARDGSYASADDPRALFVLGDEAPRRVLVRWPDGDHEAFTSLAVDRYTVLRRGEGEPMAPPPVAGAAP